MGIACGGGVAGVEDAGAAELDAGAVTFRVTREANDLLMEATAPVWIERCTGGLAVRVMGDAGAWQPLRDERPSPSEHNGYFVDDTYVRAACNLGCDVVFCDAFSSRRLDAREYLAAAPRVAPEGSEPPGAFCVGDAGAREVPSFTSRLPQGQLGVRLFYYTSDQCDSSGGPQSDGAREAIVEAR